MQDRNTATLQAIGLVCLGGLLFVTMNSMVKAMTARYDPILLIWARYFFHVVLIFLLFPRRFWSFLRPRQAGVQLLRSVLLLLSTVFNFWALVFLPLGEVAAITFSSPILVAFLAVLLLREKVATMRWMAVGLGFLGVILVVRPGGEAVNIGTALALGCAAAYALYQVSTRIVREAEPFVSLLHGGLFGMVVFSVLVPFVWQPVPLIDWAQFVVIGFLGAIGHLFVIMALQRAEASRVSPFTYAQLLWAMLASFLVFGDVPSLMTIAGAAVIVGSGLWLYSLDLRERRMRRAAA